MPRNAAKSAADKLVNSDEDAPIMLRTRVSTRRASCKSSTPPTRSGKRRIQDAEELVENLEYTEMDISASTDDRPKNATARIQRKRKQVARASSKDSDYTDSDDSTASRQPKRKAVVPRKSRLLIDHSVEAHSKATRPGKSDHAALPLERVHATNYHRAMLLDDKATCTALLAWFEGEEEKRAMPWRKKWTHPSSLTKEEVEKRAYEVWLSEIMCQQTKAATAIPYFNKFIARWPTVRDLAKATGEEVLSCWEGLGYYWRATKLLEGAKAVVEKDEKPYLIPETAEELEKLPGIGKYTAGAISSIVYGSPAPLVDGNVTRVLSRQLGLHIGNKAELSKKLFWMESELLVKHVSGLEEGERGAIPGQWNQALMELGASVCTPTPKCGECPIRDTCKAYTEGQLLVEQGNLGAHSVDMEDLCLFCDKLNIGNTLDASALGDIDKTKSTKKKRQKNTGSTTSPHFALRTHASTTGAAKRKSSNITVPKRIIQYCSLFPKKGAKKQLPSEEIAVCIIELRSSSNSSNSKWLIEKRPSTGLLASLWQFPQYSVSDEKGIPSSRNSWALDYVRELQLGVVNVSEATHVRDVGTLAVTFSHMRHLYTIHHFAIEADVDAPSLNLSLPESPRRQWLSEGEMKKTTLSTGMRRTWSLFKGLGHG